jgi:hypothetical protein
VAALEDSHGREEADAGTEAGTTDLELAGEVALGRETVAWFDLSLGDEGADVVDDLHGELAVSRYFVMNLFDLFGLSSHPVVLLAALLGEG